MKNDIKACAFTGHRPQSFLFGYDEKSEGYNELKRRIRNTIIQVCNAGCRKFYCGMAEGADLWCAEVVLEMKDQYDPPLEICPVIPYIAQPAVMMIENKERYRKIMNGSSEKYLVSRNFTKSCFQKRNYYMVDHSDVIIAVFDEKKQRSGTAQTVRYARRKNKQVIIIPV